VKSFFGLFALSLVNSVLINLIWFHFGQRIQSDTYVFYNVCGVGLFLYIWIESYLVKRSKKETVLIKFKIVRILLLVVFIAAFVATISDINNIKGVLIFKGNVEVFFYDLTRKKTY